jgi:hypothetical protein
MVHCMAIPKTFPAGTDQSGVASFSSPLRRRDYQILHAALKELLIATGSFRRGLQRVVDAVGASAYPQDLTNTGRTQVHGTAPP